MAVPVSFAPARGPSPVSRVDTANRAARTAIASATSGVGTTLPALLALASELSRETPIDYVKVAEIRAAIANGSYRVDAERIANALIAFGKVGRE